MTGLEDTFGEDFVKDYQQQIAKRREERTTVGDEAKREIAHLAVNENKFKDGEPQFQYVTDSDVTHDVYLMQLPQMDGRSIFSYANELDSGAVTCPMDYLGEWWSCLFNNPDDLKEMDEGEYYIVIGQYDTWEKDNGEVKEQVSPVRGVMTLAEAKKLAEDYLNSEVNDAPEEDDEEEEEESSDGEDDSPSFGGFGDDEDEEEEESDVDEADVYEVVEKLAAQDEQVWEVEKGDDRLQKLTKVVCNRLDYDMDEVGEEVGQMCLDRIDDHGSEDDDEEEAIFG